MASDALEVLEKLVPPSSSKTRKYSEPHYRAVRDEIIALRGRVKDCEGAIRRREQMLSDAQAVIAGLKAASQPDTVEPVAWSWVSGGRHVTADKPYADQLVADGVDVQPLYAHPPAKPDAVAVERQLLERAYEVIASGGGELDCSVEDALRALLDQEPSQ